MANSNPSRSPKFTRKGRSRLAPEDVKAIREEYAWARQVAATAATPEDWETVQETERRVGHAHGLSHGAVHAIVLGLTYPSAPGPIDRARRARYDRYQEESERLGPDIARSRLTDLDVNTSMAPSRVVVMVTKPDGTGVETSYPVGTRVTVVVAGVDE